MCLFSLLSNIYLINKSRRRSRLAPVPFPWISILILIIIARFCSRRIFIWPLPLYAPTPPRVELLEFSAPIPRCDTCVDIRYFGSVERYIELRSLEICVFCLEGLRLFSFPFRSRGLPEERSECKHLRWHAFRLGVGLHARISGTADLLDRPFDFRMELLGFTGLFNPRRQMDKWYTCQKSNWLFLLKLYSVIQV